MRCAEKGCRRWALRPYTKDGELFIPTKCYIHQHKEPKKLTQKVYDNLLKKGRQ